MTGVQKVPRTTGSSIIRHNTIPPQEPVGGGGGGGINVTENVTPGIALSQRFEQSGTQLASGVAVAQGPITALSSQTPGVAVTQSASGTPQVAQTPGIALSQRFTQASSIQTIPAAEIVQVRYDLTSRKGSSAVTNIGTFAWTSPANAEGFNTVTSTATMAGNLTAAREGILNAAYADFTGKTDLAISLVRLHFYVSSTGTVANNGMLNLAYRVSGSGYAGATVLETITGDVASLSVPRTFDITAAVAGSWANLDALTAFVRGQTDIAETLVNYAVNAVEVEVLASLTDAL